MNEEQFTEIALKVLSGEADAAERARLETALREDKALALEFESLRETFLAARQSSPLLAARHPESVPFPEYRLQELQASVRAAFPQKKAGRKESLLPLFRYLFSPWGGAAFALLAVSFVLLSNTLNPKPYVAIGMYAEEATRGENASPTMDFADATTHRFDSDAAFAAWLASPFSKGEKARIWIDEEKDLLHIRTPLAEKTEPLPPTPQDRTTRLQALAHEITGR